VANTLRSLPLLGSPAIPSPHRTLSDAVAFTGWRALSPFRAVPACVSPRCASRASTSGPSSTEESDCGHATFPLRTARCSHGLWIEHVSDAAAPFLPCAAQSDGCWTNRLAVPTRFGVPGPESRWGGKESRLCLAPNNRCLLRTRRCAARRSQLAGSPKTATLPVPLDHSPEGAIEIGRYWLRCLPEGRHLGRAPSRPRRAQRRASSQPEGSPPRRSVSPEGARSPANRIAFPEEGVATQRQAPEGWHRWFELPPILLLRSPAYLRIGSLAANSARPKAWSLARHPRSHPEVLGRSRRTPQRDPRRNRIRVANRVAARQGGPFTARGSGPSPASWSDRSRARQSSSSSKRPNPAPKSKAPCRSRRPAGRRRSVEGRGGSAHPTRLGGDPSRAPKCSCREGP
jgi:hypothetical protein